MVFTEVAGLLFSPIIGTVLEKYGRKNIILNGFLTITVGTACLALTDFIKDDMTFLIVAVICRFIQGAGD
jgi:MFS family permease